MSDQILLRFEWQCPHCGHNNTGYAPVTNSWGSMDKQVRYCDLEDGGCDQEVVIAPRVAVTASVFVMTEVGVVDRDLALEDYRKNCIPGESREEYHQRCQR